ncbi:MAG TPA: hypothetical protein VK983_01265 [Candidatus Limnocylindrales bacterium]|nr:hypothetical protein [Candidatus Limnocylindrales bacterium]
MSESYLPVEQIAPNQLNAKIFEVTQSVMNAPVQRPFRLVSPGQSPEAPQMEEFVSERLGGRYVAVHSDDPIAYKHAVLTEEGLPVLSSLYTENNLLLMHVPAGARPLASFANSIRRNPAVFAPVFQEVGETMGHIEQYGHGSLEPMPDYQVLDQFALVTDTSQARGGQVYMIPPYNFGELEKEEVLSVLGEELMATNVVLPEQAEYLIDQVREGWRDV